MGEEFEELPPGYKFMPTDVEALKDYLLPKFKGRYISPKIICECDIYLCEPQELPGFAKAQKSFYFTPRQRKHANGNGNKTSRCIKGRLDFWKMTSKITQILDKNGSPLGRKNTLVYYSKGDAKGGATKTKYLMQEYVLDDSHKDLQTSDMLNNLVLCAIYLPESSKAKKERQSKKESQQNWSDNMESPVRVVLPTSKFIPTEYTPDLYLSDNMASPKSVLLPTDPQSAEESHRLGGALVANDFVGQDLMGEDFMGQDFITEQDVVPQQTMENTFYGNCEALLNADMGGNLIWPSNQSSVQPVVNSSGPSILDEFISTGDHRLDFDNSSCDDIWSGNGICESWPDFQQDQFQSSEVNELDCLVNSYEQLCNS